MAIQKRTSNQSSVSILLLQLQNAPKAGKLNINFLALHDTSSNKEFEIYAKIDTFAARFKK
ncbi:MAG: hypothetical protein ACERKD_13705 [Prolixibacteraceae bacterium]